MFLGNNCNEEQRPSSLQKPNPNRSVSFPSLRFQIPTLRWASQYELSFFNEFGSQKSKGLFCTGLLGWESGSSKPARKKTGLLFKNSGPFLPFLKFFFSFSKMVINGIFFVKLNKVTQIFEVIIKLLKFTVKEQIIRS